MIRILIADDHPYILKGLWNIIREEPDMEVTAEANDGAEAIRLINEKDLDIAVLDINMPQKNGIEVMHYLRSKRNKLPVLILSVHPEEQYATRVIKNGASGYMTKDSAPNELIDAIRKIYTGGKYVSPGIASMLLSEYEKGIEDNENPHRRLSEREFEIMKKIASGMKAGEIARKLKISVKTVATYRQRLMEKMNMNTNMQLTKYAYDRRLI